MMIYAWTGNSNTTSCPVDRSTPGLAATSPRNPNFPPVRGTCLTLGVPSTIDRRPGLNTAKKCQCAMMSSTRMNVGAGVLGTSSASWLAGNVGTQQIELLHFLNLHFQSLSSDTFHVYVMFKFAAKNKRAVRRAGIVTAIASPSVTSLVRSQGTSCHLCRSILFA